MPGKGPLARPADISYLYDGSWQGLLCCVYESVYGHELPCAIWPEGEAQPSLYEVKTIPRNDERAARVERSIPEKISARAMELVRKVFLSAMPQRELGILRFLLYGYQTGSAAPWQFGHPDVQPLIRAEQHLNGETHLLKGFVRFSDYDGHLAATITPKNFVLPFLAPHFAARYSQENYMIFDKTHKAALLHTGGQSQIVPMEHIDFPEADPEELAYRALWCRFYKTIAIEARENPRCRMTHMPKRYWENMVEMQEYL